MEHINEASRSIPETIKRRLRQEARFGCCVCGYPIFEYHHILEFAKSPHHNPDDMMILCPNHHHQVTASAMSESEQRAFKLKPYNATMGYTEGQLKIDQSAIGVSLGSIQMVGPGFKIIVDGSPILELYEDENRVLLSIQVYDELDRLLFSIDKNEWITGDPTPWDFEFGYKWLKIRKKKGHIGLGIDARREPIDIRGDLWKAGQHFNISPSKIKFDGVSQNIGFENLCFVNMQICVNTTTKKLSLDPAPPIGKAAFVSWPDPAERFKRGIEAYKKLRDQQTESK